MTIEYVLVPKEHLLKVENARQLLYEMFANANTRTIIRLQPITGPMWTLGNTKYKTAKQLK